MPRTLVCAGVLAALFACSGEPQLAGQAPSPFDSSRAWEHLRRQVAFGPRPAGSAALAACRRYILDQLASVEVAAREQIFEADTPLGPITMVNVIATIPGSRPDRLAIGSHYDTKLFREFRFVGASDGASSTAVLLELARVLKSRRNPMTIELIFFDGEEATVAWEGTDHTYGSRHYVQAAQKAGMLGSLKAFILLDLVGDRRLNIRRDTNSTDWLVDTIWSAATRIGHGASFPQESFTVGGDDHFPFLAAGVPSVDIIDLDYAAWHRPEDTLDAVSARSLQITGEVVLEALPEIEKRLTRGR